jgi:hypothetical protein
MIAKRTPALIADVRSAKIAENFSLLVFKNTQNNSVPRNSNCGISQQRESRGRGHRDPFADNGTGRTLSDSEQ